MFEKLSDDVIIDKLTILYVLNKFQIGLTNSKLTEIILELELINYFSLQITIPTLIESKLIAIHKINNTQIYVITQSGSKVLDLFEDRLPLIVKDKITNYKVTNYIKKQNN